jgi:uncharacterized protein (DUF58 family)
MTTAVTGRFHDVRALAALEHLRFATSNRIEGSFSGRHISRQRGGAGEFVDYREYTDGEDLRRLDWKVLARSGRAYVRLHQDETNLIGTLALDTSGSMLFGAHGGRRGPLSKLEYMQYLASALAHVIARGSDQVGLALLGERLRELSPPGATPTHMTRIYESIESIATQPATRMAGSLSELFERTTRRGVLVVISDFLMDDLAEVFAALRLFRHRQWEVLAVHLVHPDEEQLPEGTAFRFVGLENDGWLDCSPAEIRSSYTQQFAAHLASVRTAALAIGCDYRRISTAVDYLSVLRAFLVERAG